MKTILVKLDHMYYTLYRVQMGIYGCVWMRTGALVPNNEKTR